MNNVSGISLGTHATFVRVTKAGYAQLCKIVWPKNVFTKKIRGVILKMKC